MRYVAIVLSPLLLFAGVLAAGLWLTADSPQWPTEYSTAVADPVRPQVRVAKVEANPAAGELPVRPESRLPRIVEPGVPPGLIAPLRAVAPEVNLCIPHSLERDLGPIDVAVRFTPVRSGAFARGVTVATSWHDEEVERCIAEVFEEVAFLPEPDGDFRPSEFVFHFPDDARRGLLGMRFVR